MVGCHALLDSFFGSHRAPEQFLHVVQALRRAQISGRDRGTAFDIHRSLRDLVA